MGDFFETLQPMKRSVNPQESVREIIDLCGGAQAIADAAAAYGRPIERKSVYNWMRIGIPEKYWDVLRCMTQVSIERLHSVNEAVRRAADVDA